MEQKKTLWHSELVGLGEIDVVIQSEVTPSKFAGKSPWVAMIVNGRERYYSCENEDCADALRGLKGQKVHLAATGGRDDAAIHIGEVSEEAPPHPGQDVFAKLGQTAHPSQGAPNRPAQTVNGDPRQHQIMRQHSQEMALRYFALNGTVPSTTQLRDMTSWFQRDINHQPIKEELE